MSDEPSFDFLLWEELPVGVRRNRKKMYNYLVSVLGGDEPGPTPTGTGTVTVTGVDSDNVPLTKIRSAYIYTGDVPPTDEDDSMVVAMGNNNDGNVANLYLYDTATHQPTEETAIPFGDYTLNASGLGVGNIPVEYSGALTVDGDETVTITLTE